MLIQPAVCKDTRELVLQLFGSMLNPHPESSGPTFSDGDDDLDGDSGPIPRQSPEHPSCIPTAVRQGSEPQNKPSEDRGRLAPVTIPASTTIANAKHSQASCAARPSSSTHKVAVVTRQLRVSYRRQLNMSRSSRDRAGRLKP
jgi:hypothetical protein